MLMKLKRVDVLCLAKEWIEDMQMTQTQSVHDFLPLAKTF